MFKVITILPFALISACSAYDINAQPTLAVEQPAKFSVESSEPAFQQSWWKDFENKELNALVDKSLQNNFSIAQSVAVLNQANAIIPQTKSGGLPQINIEGRRSQLLEGNSFAGDSLEVAAVLSWELDFWGKISNATKAENLRANARAADVEAVKLSLSAEIANAYFGAIAANEQIGLILQQLKLDKDLAGILQLRFENGVGTEVDLLQQRAQVADSETLLPLAESQLAVFENRLDVLLGEVPDSKPRVSQDNNLDFAAKIPAIGVPAALLLNRPDLIAARNDFIAADADIGVAIANRLPSIVLAGDYGYEDSGAVVGAASLVSASFVQPLLDWGRRKAEVERNKAVYEERLAAYTQAFLEAVEQVENALLQESKQRKFLAKLGIQRDFLQRTVNAAELRYKEGLDDYQPVITALQRLREVERGLVSGKLELLAYRINLFRAIGGPVEDNNNKVTDEETN